MADITETIVSLVNGATSVKMFPIILPQGAPTPAIVYHVSNTVDANHAGGQSGLRAARFQFDSYSATSYAEARSVSKGIRDALNGYKTIIEDEIDMPSNPAVKGRQYRVMLQATIWFNE
jgi:hypothetical protein